MPKLLALVLSLLVAVNPALHAYTHKGQLQVRSSAGTQAASSLFEVASTTKGSLPCPKMTQAQRDAISSPATGLCVDNTDTNQLNRYNGSAWVGVGSSEGGKNYISPYHNAESGVGTWTCYADAAGTEPVDGTGGTADVTWTTTTSSPLSGNASFLFTKDASNRQGQGCAYAFTLDSEDTSKRLTTTLSFQAASGTFASGSTSDLRVFVYDVTNNRILGDTRGTPFLAQSGALIHEWDSTSSTSYRFIVHQSTTSAVAFTTKVDSIVTGPNQFAYGASVGNRISYTPTIGGLGTGSATATGYWRQVGDSAEIEVRVLKDGSGGSGGSNVSFSLPSGLTIDTTKLANSTMVRGVAERDSNDTIVLALASTSTSNLYFNFSGASFAANTQASATVTVPIVGFGSNTVLANTRTFRISEVSQTRVTGAAPTKVGEYRSYLRQASTNTYSETNGSPTATPTAADGFRIYNGNTWALNDNSNEPSRYDVFVGRNKNVSVEFYASTGKTGSIDCSPRIPIASGAAYGYGVHYDKSTGIVSFWTPHNVLADAHVSGSTPSGTLSDPYFDIVVGETPTTLAAEPSIALRATNMTASASSTGLVDVVMTSEANGGGDPHSLHSTSTGIVTVNSSAWYMICAAVGLQGTKGSTRHELLIADASNNTLSILEAFTPSANVTADHYISGCTDYYFTGGSQFKVRVDRASSTLQVGTGSATKDFLTVRRLGN